MVLSLKPLLDMCCSNWATATPRRAVGPQQGQVISWAGETGFAEGDEVASVIGVPRSAGRSDRVEVEGR